MTKVSTTISIGLGTSSYSSSKTIATGHEVKAAGIQSVTQDRASGKSTSAVSIDGENVIVRVSRSGSSTDAVGTHTVTVDYWY